MYAKKRFLQTGLSNECLQKAPFCRHPLPTDVCGKAFSADTFEQRMSAGSAFLHTSDANGCLQEAHFCRQPMQTNDGQV
ncbi:hypothetical protein N9L68_02495 [bacterium]|nr:hypothetical protein [bacterium]